MSTRRVPRGVLGRRITATSLALTILGASLAPSTPAAAEEAAPPPGESTPRHEDTKPPFVLDLGAVGALEELRVARGNSHIDKADFMALGFASDGGGLTLGAGIAPTRAGQFGAMLRARYIYTRPLDLAAHFVSLGGEGNFAATRAVHLVGGGHLGWLALVRATNGELVQHWGIGATLGVELVPLEGSTSLYFRPEATATLIPHALVNPWSLAWGGTLTAGVRFAL